MLSPQEIYEIDKEIAKVPLRRSAGLKALLVIQRHRGHVSDEGLKEVAEYIAMPATELDGIATFYNLIYRKPVGRHVIRICDSISCWIMGYERVCKKICEHLDIEMGQTTSDKQFTLLTSQCLGTCDGAPAMMIDDELYTNLEANTIGSVIDQHQKKRCESTNSAPSNRYQNAAM